LEKRIAYLNPIRMYVFISGGSFLISFSGKSEEEPNNAVQNLQNTGNKLHSIFIDIYGINK